MIISQNGAVDLIPEYNRALRPIFCVSEGDANSRTINLTVTSAGEVFTIPEGAEVYVAGKKQDNTIFTYQCAYSGYIVSFPVAEQMSAANGLVLCELQIVVAGDPLGSANFCYWVEPSPIANGSSSESDLNIFEQAIAALGGYDYLTGEVATLSARMDQFARLPDGSLSTAADAELADIRVKADGLTATTAGDAVREQITQLHDEVNYIGRNIINTYTELAGKYLSATAGGIIQSYNYGTCMIVIPIEYGAKYKLKRYLPTVMRWATGNAVDPGIGEQVNGLTEIARDDFNTYSIENPGDKYLYIQLFVNGDDAQYKNIAMCVSNLLLLIDQDTEISDLKDDISALESAFPVIAIRTQGDGQTQNANIAAAPYVLNKQINGDVTIRALELNVVTAGTLTLSVIKKDEVVRDQPYDSSKLEIKTTISTAYTGLQMLWLEEPFTLKEDEYLACGINTDTLVFTYGSRYTPEGTSAGFLFINTNNNVWQIVVNSTLGINVYATGSEYAADNARGAIQSIYSGKKLSILGDSISTFEGYIPAGNRAYYPASGVDFVTDTWWYKLMRTLNMSLEVNNSWGGSRVTTTDGDEKAGCMTRCQSLGNPDVVIVYMGINDFDSEVDLGTWNGSTALPSVTTTFREAYAIMLDKILTAYKTAEVWVCTLTQAERNGDEGFPEINGNNVPLSEFNKAIMELADIFGVRVLHHHSCGLTYQNMDVFDPSKLHPNKYGHSLIANNDIREMDNAVAKRWETAAE